MKFREFGFSAAYGKFLSCEFIPCCLFNWSGM